MAARIPDLFQHFSTIGSKKVVDLIINFYAANGETIDKELSTEYAKLIKDNEILAYFKKKVQGLQFQNSPQNTVIVKHKKLLE